ncbi:MULTISPECIES: hypothetical protein [unclassified Nostoc]|uniref:hypothetical protein n=1 Tax=unclassified Nostoc TaxID=2593658 RepID=UPI001D14ECCC|nr:MULTISPECIES: hypothetical protein [unclassified Nostoc]
MSDSVQYVTNAQGNKVGVLLDLETYQQLANISIDSELLIGLSLDELQALRIALYLPNPRYNYKSC